MTIQVQRKDQLVKDLIMQELELMTRQGKARWFKLRFSANSHFFKCRYQGLEINVFPNGQEWTDRVVINELDQFNRHTYYQTHFNHENRGELVRAIEATNPDSADAVHNIFFPRDIRPVEEQVLGQLLIGRSPLEPSNF